MKKIVFLVLLAAFSNSGFAQSDDGENDILIEEPQDGESPAPAPAPRVTRRARPAPASSASSSSSAASNSASSAASNSVSDDYFKPGWNSNKLDHGIGFNGSFLGVGNAFIYEKGFSRPRSWSFYLGFAKTSDTFTNSNQTSGTGVATGSYTTTTTFSGSKNPMTLSVGASHNWRLYKNSFLETRWGIFTGIDYYTDTKYDTGSISATFVSKTPGTLSVTHNSRGTISVSKSPALRIGPVFDTNIFLRWFPNLSAGMQGGIIYASNVKTKTRTQTTSETYQVINGVKQTSTAYTQVDKTDTLDTGGTGSTIVIAGQTFGFTGTFTIRYLW